MAFNTTDGTNSSGNLTVTLKDATNGTLIYAEINRRLGMAKDNITGLSETERGDLRDLARNLSKYVNNDYTGERAEELTNNVAEFIVTYDENGNALYIPKGCAHGFISLKDNSQLIYFMTTAYSPKHERGYRWNDPAFAIQWPMEPVVISPKDSSWPLMTDGDVK